MGKLSLLWGAVTNSPFFLYAKLAGIAALVAGAAYIAWDYRSAISEREVTAAVADAMKEVNVELRIERQQRKFYQDLAEEKYGALMEKLTNIKITNTLVRQDIIHEIDSNPEFYTMKLPQKGYESWLKSRALMAPAIAASAPSKP